MSPKPPDKKKTQAVVESVRTLIVEMLADEHFTPNTFREIHEIADAAHTMLSKVDPILSVPRGMPTGVLASAPSSETYGAKIGREMIQMFDKLTGGRNKSSRLDLVKAIAFAEQHGLTDEATLLREELEGDEEEEEEDLLEGGLPDDASPAAKVTRADHLIARARALQQKASLMHDEAKVLLEEAKPYVKD